MPLLVQTAVDGSVSVVQAVSRRQGSSQRNEAYESEKEEFIVHFQAAGRAQPPWEDGRFAGAVRLFTEYDLVCVRSAIGLTWKGFYQEVKWLT